MNEHSYIRAVHRHLPGTVYALKLNLNFNRGVADCWYSGDLSDLWVEFKWLKTTPKRRFTPSLSELQLHWLRKRHEEGRAVLVAQGTPAGGTLIEIPELGSSIEVTEWKSHKEMAAMIRARVSST